MSSHHKISSFSHAFPGGLLEPPGPWAAGRASAVALDAIHFGRCQFALAQDGLDALLLRDENLNSGDIKHETLW